MDILRYLAMNLDEENKKEWEIAKVGNKNNFWHEEGLPDRAQTNYQTVKWNQRPTTLTS